MKPILLLLLYCAAAVPGRAQKLLTRNGNVSFFSRTRIIDIEAHNRSAISVIDGATGRVEFAVLMKGFEFEKALMQEHFNDDYVESDRYPRSSFKGTITNLAAVNFTRDGTYPVTLTGDMTLHGVTLPLTVQGQVRVERSVVTATSEFHIALSDYKIDVPAAVRGEIANRIAIKVNFKYQ